MKKNILISLILASLVLAGCSQGEKDGEVKETETEVQTETEKKVETEKEVAEETETETETEAETEENLQLSILKDADSYGLAYLIDDYKENGNIKFEIADDPNAVVESLKEGRVKMAILPADKAAKLVKDSSGQIKITGVTLLGKDFLAENGSSIEDIGGVDGKKVYLTREDDPSSAHFLFALENNGYSCQVEYLGSEDAVSEKLGTEEGALGVLSEPALSKLAKENPSVRPALNLSEEWEKTEPDLHIVSGVLVAREDFLEEESDLYSMVIEGMSSSIDSAAEEPQEASKLLNDTGMVDDQEVAESALENMNASLVFYSGEDMVPILKNYYDNLSSQNPSLIGSLPEDSDYFAD